jgi:hypothetical protein
VRLFREIETQARSPGHRRRRVVHWIGAVQWSRVYGTNEHVYLNKPRMHIPYRTVMTQTRVRMGLPNLPNHYYDAGPGLSDFHIPSCLYGVH